MSSQSRWIVKGGLSCAGRDQLKKEGGVGRATTNPVKASSISNARSLASNAASGASGHGGPRERKAVMFFGCCLCPPGSKVSAYSRSS